MSKQEFKAGDRIEFTEDYSRVPLGAEGTVTSVKATTLGDEGESQLVTVDLDRGDTAAAFNGRMKLLVESPFKIGDTVSLKDQGEYQGAWSGPMTVTDVYPSGSFGARHPIRGVGAFCGQHLEAYVEPEQEAKPVTFRICVGSTIGTTEYPSLESAKAAALLHGNTDEQFTIFEVLEIASFRVDVKKTLVETF